MNAAEERLASLKIFLAHVRERLGIDVGFALLDGSSVPAVSTSTTHATCLTPAAPLLPVPTKMSSSPYAMTRWVASRGATVMDARPTTSIW